MLNTIRSLNSIVGTGIWRNDDETRHPVPFLEARAEVYTTANARVNDWQIL